MKYKVVLIITYSLSSLSSEITPSQRPTFFEKIGNSFATLSEKRNLALQYYLATRSFEFFFKNKKDSIEPYISASKMALISDFELIKGHEIDAFKAVKNNPDLLAYLLTHCASKQMIYTEFAQSPPDLIFNTLNKIANPSCTATIINALLKNDHSQHLRGDLIGSAIEHGIISVVKANKPFRFTDEIKAKVNQAIQNGHTEIIPTMCEFPLDYINSSSIQKALDNKHSKIVCRLIVKKKAWTETFLDQAFELALNKGDMESINFLLMDGVKSPSPQIEELSGRWISVARERESRLGKDAILRGYADETFNFLKQNKEKLQQKLFNSDINSAISNGHTQVIQLLLERNPELLTSITQHSFNDAISNGHAQVIQLLLERNPELLTSITQHSFNDAISNGHAQIIQLLLERNPELLTGVNEVRSEIAALLKKVFAPTSRQTEESLLLNLDYLFYKAYGQSSNDMAVLKIIRDTLFLNGT